MLRIRFYLTRSQLNSGGRPCTALASKTTLPPVRIQCDSPSVLSSPFARVL